MLQIVQISLSVLKHSDEWVKSEIMENQNVTFELNSKMQVSYSFERGRLLDVGWS